MAVISVKEILGARTGKIDQTWRRTYHRVFRVQTDNQWTGALEVRQSCPVQLGNSYSLYDSTGTLMEFDQFAYCVSVEVVIDNECDDDNSWLVAVDYGAFDPTEFPENPLDHPIKMSWSGDKYDRVCTQTVPDDDGNIQAVVNSAGDYFDPPFTVDDSRPTLKIVRNERKYDQQYAILWKDRVNEDEFFGFDPGTVKISFPTAELEYSTVCGFYWVVEYNFTIKPEGWTAKILDQGLRKWDGESEKSVPCQDKNGEDVTSPVLLDGNGAQMPIGNDPVFLEYDVYLTAKFEALNLRLQGAPGTVSDLLNRSTS